MTVPVASDSPAASVTEISDPASAGAGVELIDLDAMQLESQPLRARRVVVRLGTVSAVFHASNQRLRTHTSVHKGLLGYVTFGPQARGAVNGVPVRPGLLLAAAPESAARFVVESGWESITLLVPPEEIAAHWMARRWAGAFRPPRGVERLQAAESLVCGLFDWGKRLVETAVEQPALFNQREEERAAAKVELIEALLATLRQTRERAGGLGRQPQDSLMALQPRQWDPELGSGLSRFP